MTLSISLSPEGEAKLRARAAAEGKDVGTIVREVVEQSLGMSDLTERQSGMTAQQWSAEWHAWAASHRKLDYIVDDSRESIYADRGE